MNTATQLNPTQLHLLKMFSYTKSETTLDSMKQVLVQFYSQKLDDEMERLWDEGLWDEQKNEDILKEHLRTHRNG